MLDQRRLRRDLFRLSIGCIRATGSEEAIVTLDYSLAGFVAVVLLIYLTTRCASRLLRHP